MSQVAYGVGPWTGGPVNDTGETGYAPPQTDALLCRGVGSWGRSPMGSESRIFSASEGKPFPNEMEAKQFDVMIFIKRLGN